MIGFILGTAVIVLPRGNLPLLAAIGTVKGAAALRRHLKDRTANKLAEDEASDAEGQNGRCKAPAPERGVPPVILEWSDLTCTYTSKTGEKKEILRGVAGAAQPGRLLALMGPSGSGKTSLLNSLANQMGQSKRLKLEGEITVNGTDSSASNHKQAYVEQTDNFYSMLTVAETLDTTSQLQLPASLPADRKQAYVDRLVTVLGLAKVVNTQVGDEKQRGLSGGEKKRLAIGCELISSPSLIFLDEPTTGLDAFQAEKVINTVKQLADLGHTVVTSIHQPRSSIFAMFDDLLLLSEGAVVYAGPAEAAIDYFAGLGHTCPEHYNPAEFLADLISIDYTSPEAEAAARGRVAELAKAWQKAAGEQAHHREHIRRTASGLRALGSVRREPGVGWLKQFLLLLRRSWRQITRDKATARSRLMSNLSSALIFGAIFFRMRRKQSSIQDRMGLLQVCAINTAMSAMVKTLNVFPKERTIVTRERARSAYQLVPYLTAKLLAEFPVSALFPLVFGGVVYPLTGLHRKSFRFARFLGILTVESFAAAALGLAVGAVAPSTDAALAIGPAVMLVWIIFGGYYVNAANIPGALRWLPRASLIKHAFEALAINEFKGLEFELDSKAGGMKTGEDVLKWLSFGGTTIPSAMGSQARILLAYYWITYYILKAKKPKFQPLLPPPAAAAAATPVAAAGAAEGPAEGEAAVAAGDTAAAAGVDAGAA